MRLPATGNALFASVLMLVVAQSAQAADALSPSEYLQGIAITEHKTGSISSFELLAAKDKVSSESATATSTQSDQVAAVPSVGDGTWFSFGSVRHGCNGAINAAVTMANGDQVFGGSFSACGGVVAKGLARWDGLRWYAYGGNGWQGTVNALATAGNDLYVGGTGGALATYGGPSAIYIARWDGSAWYSYASDSTQQLNGFVNAIAIYGSDLIVGGAFLGLSDGLQNRSHVARFSAGAWLPLGTDASNGVDGPVNALTVSGSNLYVGGAFANASGIAANRIARWNGSAWASVGSGAQNGLDDTVWALAVSGSDIMVGGAFQRAGGQLAGGIARWNGSQWFPLGSNPAGVTGTVRTLRIIAGQTYVGGSMSFAGTLPISNVARWNGSTWSALGGGIGDASAASTDSVRAFAQWNGPIHAFGMFSQTGTAVTNGVARWNGSTWQALIDPTDATQITGEVYATATNGTDVYVGGAISQVGDLAVNNIARWNGSAWSAVGAGVNGPVNALAHDGATLYAGGDFSLAAGQTASNLARWDGSAWHPVGNTGAQGTDAAVYSLAAGGGRLFAGGFFTHAGGVSAPHIAMFANSTWSGLDDGTNSEVYALSMDSEYLYAGGKFLQAGSIAANHIARWNGVQWYVLPAGNNGDGVNGTVYALHKFDNRLYVGGQFSQFGATPSANVAIWSNETWSSPGGGIAITGDAVSALHVYAGRLYASSFNGTLFGWNGIDWRLMSSSGVAINRTLTSLGNRLYLGGTIYNYGTVASTGLVGFSPEQIFRGGFEIVPPL